MIKEKFEELKRERIFKEAKDKGNLFLVFAITDANLKLEQIDFSFIKDKAITCFSFKNGVWHKTLSKEKRSIHYDVINFDINLNIQSIESIYNKVNKILKNKNLCANKFIFILQNLKGKTVFNLTCLCSNFYVYKITFDAKTLKIINKKLYNLINFFEFKK